MIKLSRFRLWFNGIACVLIVLICLSIAVELAMELGKLPPPKPNDPDAGKVLWSYGIGIVGSGLLGVAALFSLIRTLKLWREKS